MTDDAEIILVGMGTISLPDEGRHPQHARSRARRSASCGSRWFRPFPTERARRRRSRSAKAIGVIDRDYSFGSPFHSGVVANEIRAAMYNADKRPPLLSFICGLGGREVTLEDVDKATDMCYAAAKAGQVRRPRRTGSASASRSTMTMAEHRVHATRRRSSSRSRASSRSPLEEYFTSGHRTCQGCESALVMKLHGQGGRARARSCSARPAACTWPTRRYYTTPWVVPWMHTQLGSSGSAALGTAAGLKALMTQGQDEVGADQRHRVLRRRRRRRHGARRASRRR